MSSYEIQRDVIAYREAERANRFPAATYTITPERMAAIEASISAYYWRHLGARYVLMVSQPNYRGATPSSYGPKPMKWAKAVEAWNQAMVESADWEKAPDVELVYTLVQTR